MVQNKSAHTKISSKPAGAPPPGTSQYTTVDGMTGAMTGTSNPAGMMYATTASKNGASANANTPRAIAATIPTAADLKNIFMVRSRDALRHYEVEHTLGMSGEIRRLRS